MGFHSSRDRKDADNLSVCNHTLTSFLSALIFCVLFQFLQRLWVLLCVRIVMCSDV